MTRKKWTDEDVKKLRKLWATDMPATDIADSLHVRASALHVKARNLGLPPRTVIPGNTLRTLKFTGFDVNDKEQRIARLDKTPFHINEDGHKVYECPTIYADGYNG